MSDSVEDFLEAKIKMFDEINDLNKSELRKVFIILQVKTHPDLYENNKQSRKKRSFIYGLWNKITLRVNKKFPKYKVNGKNKFSLSVISLL